MADIDAAEVLRAYVATLREPGRTLIRDSSALPYAKDVIKIVLRHAMTKADDQTLEHLKVAYISLADFQPLSEPERRAIDLFGRGLEATAATAKDIASVGPVYTALTSRCMKEAESLHRELEALTT